MNLTAIGFSLFSLHLPYGGQDQFNPGIHMESDNVRAGFYRNSNADSDLPDTTTYMGYSVPLYVSRTFRAGALVALAHGYRSPIIGGLELRVGQHFVVMAAPPIKTSKHESPTVLGFVLRFPTR